MDPMLPIRTVCILRSLCPWSIRAYAFKDTDGTRYCIFHGKLYVSTPAHNKPHYKRGMVCLGAFMSGWVSGPKFETWCDVGGLSIRWKILHEQCCNNCKDYGFETEEECGAEGGQYCCMSEKGGYCELGEPHEVKGFICRNYVYDGGFVDYRKTLVRHGHAHEFLKVRPWTLDDGFNANRDLEEYGAWEDY